jgi:hypothetical protein
MTVRISIQAQWFLLLGNHDGDFFYLVYFASINVRLCSGGASRFARSFHQILCFSNAGTALPKTIKLQLFRTTVKKGVVLVLVGGQSLPYGAHCLIFWFYRLVSPFHMR